MRAENQLPRRRANYGLKDGRNYKPRDPDDLDWVFLVAVDVTSRGLVAHYMTCGGYGDHCYMPAREFRRKYRRLFDYARG